MINLWDNTPNQPTKFRTKNWVEINDDSHGMYNTNSQIKFNTSMLKLSLCDYSDAYILVSGTISRQKTKKVIFKSCAPLTDCISEINNTQVDHEKDLDVMPVYNLIEYSDNYSKTSGHIWQYYIHKPNDTLTDSESFKFKAGITRCTPDDDNTKDVKTAVQELLKCL